MALTALTRDVNVAMGECELTFLSRSSINVENAIQQHKQYQSVLSEAGCEVLSVSTAQGLADSVFIEDTALVLDALAVLCRPGAASRRAEVAGTQNVLRKFRRIESIQEPGTLDGGDLLVVGKVIFAGLSTRSNSDGIDQLRNVVSDYGYSVVPVETTKCLHLKSAVSVISPGVLLINPDWIEKSIFKDYVLLAVDESESHAANALPVGNRLIYPNNFPRTAEKLSAHGMDVAFVDVSELQKAEGAVTCCSLIFEAA
jgi:dimethylargininase